MPSYQQWLETHKFDDLTTDLPPKKELEKMTRKHIKEKYGTKIICAANKQDITITEKDLDAIIDKAAGIEEWPDFHQNHYHIHM